MWHASLAAPKRGRVYHKSRAGAGGCLRTLQQLVESNRQVSNALPGCVEDRVRNGRSYARDPDFADSTRAQGRMFVGYAGINDFDVRHVQIDRHMILGERWIHDSSSALV